MFTIERISLIAPSKERRPNTFLSAGLHRWLFFLVLSFFPTLGYSAKILVVNSTQDMTPLSQFIGVLNNPQNLITKRNILESRHLNGLTPINLNTADALNTFSQHIWLAFTLRNSHTYQLNLWLNIVSHNINHVMIYMLDEKNGLKALHTESKSDSYLTPILLQPQKTQVFFVQVYLKEKKHMEINLVDPKTHHLKETHSAYALGILFGALISFILLSMICFWYYREWLFLFFSIQLFASLCLQLIHTPLQWDWLKQINYLGILSIICIITCANAAQLFFYLKSWSLHRPYCRPILGILTCSLILALLYAFTFKGYSPYLWGIYALYIPLFITGMLHCYQHKNDRMALFIILIKIVALSIVIGALFFSENVSHSHYLSETFVLFILLLESSLTLIFFANHFNMQYRDHQREILYAIANTNKTPSEQTILKNITHDLRTPVAGIMGIADLLKNASASAEQGELIDSITVSGQQLLNKINEVSSHIQLQASSQTPKKTLFELPLLIDECAYDYRPIVDEKNIEFIFNIHNDIPVVVYGDENRLRQVLKQLVKNAITHTSQGEVLINVQPLDKSNNEILFSVKDSGQGINPQKLKDIQTGKNLPSMSGLSMVHLHLKALSSKLSITSKLGDGSEFNFALKLTEPAHVKEEPQERHLHRSLLSQKHLLIIDDNRTCCRVLRQQTTGLGMTAIETYNGKEALAMFRGKRNLGEPFDAIIIDYDMPHLNGLQVATKLLDESKEPPIIIMLTGLSIMPDTHSLKEAGIHAVLNKPVSQKLIKLTLLDLFAQKESKEKETIQSTVTDQKLNILVAEDNDVSRRVISKMIELLGHSYKMVSNGQLAVDAVKKESFDVILMDCEMPVMNGFDATIDIHRSQKAQGKIITPVYALSAHIFEEQKSRSLHAGMTDFLEKPIKLDRIKQLLDGIKKTC